jgi:hypothetical protein
LISLEILANGGGKTEELFIGNAVRRFDWPFRWFFSGPGYALAAFIAGID